VPRQVVNWCARSTFYSEKAAWKEFDRRNISAVHGAAHEAQAQLCPPQHCRPREPPEC